MKFDGYMIVSDMDNTLLDNEHKVSKKNRAKIQYFIDNGGRFTIATGRAVPAAREHIGEILINAPAILHNGAKLYDFKTETTLFEKHIADERKEAVRIMHEKYPFLGFEIYSREIVYVYSKCRFTERLAQRGYPAVYSMPDGIWHSPWTKLLMIGEKEELDRYESEYRKYDKGYAVRSGDNFFDIVADGVSKGFGLLELSKILDYDIKKVIAVGDNMNDASMLEAAGIAYAVKNAEDEIKNIADYIAPSNNNDAIAWIIDDIEQKITAKTL